MAAGGLQGCCSGSVWLLGVCRAAARGPYGCWGSAGLLGVCRAAAGGLHGCCWGSVWLLGVYTAAEGLQGCCWGSVWLLGVCRAAGGLQGCCSGSVWLLGVCMAAAGLAAGSFRSSSRAKSIAAVEPLQQVLGQTTVSPGSPGAPAAQSISPLAWDSAAPCRGARQPSTATQRSATGQTDTQNLRKDLSLGHACGVLLVTWARRTNSPFWQSRLRREAEGRAKALSCSRAGSQAAGEGHPSAFHCSTGTDTATWEKARADQLLLKSPLSPTGMMVLSSKAAKGQRRQCVALCVHCIWVMFY